MSSNKLLDLFVKFSLASFVVVFISLVAGLKLVTGIFMIFFLISALVSIYMTMAY